MLLAEQSSTGGTVVLVRSRALSPVPMLYAIWRFTSEPIFGVRILQAPRVLSVETHLVLSRWGKTTLELETA